MLLGLEGSLILCRISSIERSNPPGSCHQRWDKWLSNTSSFPFKHLGWRMHSSKTFTWCLHSCFLDASLNDCSCDLWVVGWNCSFCFHLLTLLWHFLILVNIKLYFFKISWLSYCQSSAFEGSCELVSPPPSLASTTSGAGPAREACPFSSCHDLGPVHTPVDYGGYLPAVAGPGIGMFLLRCQ